jgi:hypothetical protein
MTYRQLIENFDYDEVSGKLIRTTKKNANGSVDRYGYIIIKFKGKQYKAHRLIWMYHYGSMPKNVIDHINSNKQDNRICNLRDITQSENNLCTKRKPNKQTGIVGVCIDNSTDGLKKKYVTMFDKKIYRFYSAEDAKMFRQSNNLPI